MIYVLLTILLILNIYIVVTIQQFKDQFAAINETTNNIAADIDRLVTQIGTPGLSEADAQAALDELTGISTKLKDIAAKTPE